MSLLSPVIVGRMALSHIGVSKNLESLTAPTPEAAQLNVWYDHSRQQTLEVFNWNFARRRMILATHAEDPPEGQWAFRYQYPFGALKIREVWHPAINPHTTDAIPFEVELATDDSKTLVTDLDEARVIWTKDITDLTLWTSLAILALSHALSSHIATALTTHKDAAARQFNFFNAIINTATSVDANEQIERQPRDADVIRARE